jgi:hypothetical protein
MLFVDHLTLHSSVGLRDRRYKRWIITPDREEERDSETRRQHTAVSSVRLRCATTVAVGGFANRPRFSCYSLARTVQLDRDQMNIRNR